MFKESFIPTSIYEKKNTFYDAGKLPNFIWGMKKIQNKSSKFLFSKEHSLYPAWFMFCWFPLQRPLKETLLED